MLRELIQGKVYYKIFDKNYQGSTHSYSKQTCEDEAKKAEVESNLKSVKDNLEASELLTLRQVHGTGIVDADLITDFSEQVVGDGAVTTKTGIALAVQTADCVPLLLASSNADVIGAAHCSWKGSKAGIVFDIVKNMRERGASNIKAFIGPAIQQASYEVDQEYYRNFSETQANYQHFFIPSKNSGRYMFNLPEFVESHLRHNGIKDITNLGEDTYSTPDKYPSYRRDSHQGDARYKQRILSTILIK